MASRSCQLRAKFAPAARQPLYIFMEHTHAPPPCAFRKPVAKTVHTAPFKSDQLSNLRIGQPFTKDRYQHTAGIHTLLTPAVKHLLGRKTRRTADEIQHTMKIILFPHKQKTAKTVISLESLQRPLRSPCMSFPNNLQVRGFLSTLCPKRAVANSLTSTLYLNSLQPPISTYIFTLLAKKNSSTATIPIAHPP